MKNRPPKNTKTNIQPIVDNQNCAQCGTCIAACPHDAIDLYNHEWRGLLPNVNMKKCTQCGICLRVCPGEEIDFYGLQKQVFGYIDKNEFFPHSMKFLSAHATDPNVRYNGASGGFVSGLLISLLKNKQIDGALVVNMRSKKPLWPNIYIARSPEEIIAAQQSKYIPVPINVGLKEILQHKNEKFAVVGVPCQIQGLRMFEKLKPRFKEQIVIRIGLLCGFNPTLSSTKFLLRRAGVKNYNDVVDIKYRDGDWPCGFRAFTKDGRDHFLYPIQHFLFSHYIFERRRCAMCMDQLNELADISVGDEWIEENRGDVQGWNSIIVRTKVGEKILLQAVERGDIKIEPSSKRHIWGGQNSTMIYKKRGTVIFGKIEQLFGRPIPEYLKRKKIVWKHEHILGAFLLVVVPRLFELKWFRLLFLNVSQKILNKYRHMIIRLFRKM